MTQSGAGTAIAADPAALRAEAALWDKESSRLSDASHAISDRHIVGYESFWPARSFLHAYNDMVTIVSTRCQEGCDDNGQIAAALRRVAQTFESANAAATIHS
jgi:hypothetical protein